MKERYLTTSLLECLVAASLFVGMSAHAAPVPPYDTASIDQAAESKAEPVVDQYGRQLHTIYLDEHLIEQEDGFGEEPMRLASDPRNAEDWRGWHRATARAAVKRLEREYGIEAVSMTSHIMPTFSAFLDPEVIRELGADEYVTKITPVMKGEDEFSAVWVDLPGGGNEVISWGKSAIGTNDWLSTTNTVYMIDGDEQSHIDLVNLEVAPVLPSYTTAPGHANHVAGILSAKAGNGYAVRGINPSSKVISVHRGDTQSQIKTALDWVLADSEQKGIYAVVNISSNGSNFKSTGAYGPWIKRLSARVLVVQSAGNNKSNACAYSWDVPEANDGILVVGGIDEDGAQAVTFDNTVSGYASQPGSNYGNCVEAWAPSQRIWSTWNTSYTAAQILSGTSMAAPHVSAFSARFGNSLSTPFQREYYVLSKVVPTGYTDAVGYSIWIPSYSYSGSPVPNLLSPLSITASSTLAGSSTNYVVDKLYTDPFKVWNSGGVAPAWIQFDFGVSRSLKAIRLTSEQWPASGVMTHLVYAGNTSPPTTLVASISGTLTSREPIVRNLEASARFVRVVTTASSSWVAWREIELYGF